MATHIRSKDNHNFVASLSQNLVHNFIWKRAARSVTHVINPHLFWYHENHVPNENYGKIYDVEKQLNQMDRENIVKPAIGTLVAVRYLPMRKLIRARVCETLNTDVHHCEIILWAIDYGFPFKCESKNVFQLPQKLTELINHVQLGGLVDIFPAEIYVESQSGSVAPKKTGKWSKLACHTMKKMLREAQTVEVMESFAVSDQSWVDIRLTTHLGKRYSIGEYLIEINLAVKAVQGFREISQQLKTTKVLHWLTNEGQNKFIKTSTSEANIRGIRKVDDRLARNDVADEKTDEKSTARHHSIRELNQVPSIACPLEISSPNSLLARVKLQKCIDQRDPTQVMPSSGLYSTALIPSGTDLSNLKSYNSEEKRWHNKANAVYDQVSEGKEKVLFDTFTTPLKKEHSISFAIAEIDQTVDFRKPNLPSNGESLISFRSSSPFTEIGKCKENLSGNKDIIDLNKLDLSGTKLDSHISTFSLDLEGDNTETSDKVNSKFDGCSNLQDFANSSNSNRFAKQKHLKGLEDPLSSELNSPQEISYKLPRFESLREIKGECDMKAVFTEHLVLTHSKSALDKIEKVSEATFCREISNRMRNLRISKLYRLQAYSWPHVSRGNSLFIVNPPRSGKTWSYLPAICDLVIYHTNRYSCARAYGPLGVILVPSYSHVGKISNLCGSLLLGVKPQVTTVASYGVRNANEVKIGLLNSCGLLIATPTSFLRLLGDNEEESLIDFKRLRHLVIDDMDSIMKRSQNELETVVQTLFKICRRFNARKKLVQSFQLVVTSRDWESTMLAMLRKSNNPLLLMGDFLEAAVYGKVAISIHLCQNEKKIDTIFQFIEKNSLASKRLIIICRTNDEVAQVTTALKASNRLCIGYSSDASVEEFAIADEWKREMVEPYRILVCTDPIFAQLQIQNAHCLVHYSMPSSWTKFTTRFGALTQTYENCVKTNFEKTTNTIKESSISLILLDEENNMQLPRLMDFMKKHNQLKYIHKDILAVSKRVLFAREEARLTERADVCPYILEFGECDEERCGYRHNLSRFDIAPKKDNIPVNGEIRILILKVFSPTHYSARLLQHRRTGSAGWEDVRRSNEVCQFGLQMNLHYTNSENLILQWPLCIGDLCVYRTSSGYFQRATILEVPELPNFNVIKSLRLVVKLIDQGIKISNAKSEDLYVCHENFKQFPSQAVDIRLLGVVPCDNERTWDESATKSVRNWLIDYVKKEECIHASVDFALAHTIWVRNVIVMETLPTLGRYIYRRNVKRSLVEQNIAMVGTKHSKIRNIVEECGLLVHNQEHEIVLATGCENDTSSIKYSLVESKNFIFPAETESPFTMRDIENNKTDVEDWDKSLMNESHKNEEIYVPIPKVVEEQNVKDGSSVSHISSHEIKEEWIKLPLHEIVKVEIGDENENGNWKDIFLQCIDDKNLNKFRKLLELTKEHIATLSDTAPVPFSASWFKPMQNCVVHYENRYLRAKLYDIFGFENNSSSVYRFFLCDYACFVTAKEEELYDNFLYPTSNEIIGFMPYQAVNCTLAGIDLIRFAKNYKVTKDYLFAYAVSEQENVSMDALKLEINSFEIIFFENESENDLSNMQMVNTALVENAVARLNSSTKHYLDIDIVKTKTRNEDDLCDFAELIDCFQGAFELEAEQEQSPTADMQKKLRKSLTETKAFCAMLKKQTQTPNDMNKSIKNTTVTKKEEKRTNGSPCIMEEEPLCPTSITAMQEDHIVGLRTTKFLPNNFGSPKKVNLDTSTKIVQDEQDAVWACSKVDVPNKTGPASHLPPLKSFQKRPKTTWYETDCSIYLTIHAPDVKDYYLEVSTSTLLFAARASEEEFVLVLNFVSFIEPQIVSHELRGLNVVVQLVKSIYVKWTRLLKEATKYSWLQYNLNAIVMKEGILPQQQMDSILLRNGQFLPNFSDSDESDDEQNSFQTFTPIVNNDVHDPTEELN